MVYLEKDATSEAVSFLPYHYKHTMRSGSAYNRLIRLSPSIRWNYNLVFRNEISDPPNKLTTKCIYELLTELQDKHYGFYFSSPNQVVSEEFEAQLARIAHRPSSLSPESSVTNFVIQTTTPTSSKSGTIYFNCQKLGHIAAKCPHSRSTLLAGQDDPVFEVIDCHTNPSMLVEDLDMI